MGRGSPHPQKQLQLVEPLRECLGLSTVVPAASQTLGFACFDPIPSLPTFSVVQRLGAAVSGEGLGRRKGEANLWWISGEIPAVEHPVGHLGSLSAERGMKLHFHSTQGKAL